MAPFAYDHTDGWAIGLQGASDTMAGMVKLKGQRAATAALVQKRKSEEFKLGEAMKDSAAKQGREQAKLKWDAWKLGQVQTGGSEYMVSLSEGIGFDANDRDKIPEEYMRTIATAMEGMSPEQRAFATGYAQEGISRLQRRQALGRAHADVQAAEEDELITPETAAEMHANLDDESMGDVNPEKLKDFLLRTRNGMAAKRDAFEHKEMVLQRISQRIDSPELRDAMGLSPFEWDKRQRQARKIRGLYEQHWRGADSNRVEEEIRQILTGNQNQVDMPALTSQSMNMAVKLAPQMGWDTPEKLKAGAEGILKFFLQGTEHDGAAPVGNGAAPVSAEERKWRAMQGMEREVQAGDQQGTIGYGFQFEEGEWEKKNDYEALERSVLGLEDEEAFNKVLNTYANQHGEIPGSVAKRLFDAYDSRKKPGAMDAVKKGAGMLASPVTNVVKKRVAQAERNVKGVSKAANKAVLGQAGKKAAGVVGAAADQALRTLGAAMTKLGIKPKEAPKADPKISQEDRELDQLRTWLAQLRKQRIPARTKSPARGDEIDSLIVDIEKVIKDAITAKKGK